MDRRRTRSTSGTDFGPGSLTTSGYPRLVKQWRRGTPLSEATVVAEGKPDDVSVNAYHDQTEGFERDFVIRNTDFFHSEWQLRAAGGDLVPVDVPDDAEHRRPPRVAAGADPDPVGGRRHARTRPGRCWRPGSMSSWPASGN